MRRVKLSLLLVEDCQPYNFNTKKIIEASGLVDDAVICSSGNEAIEYLNIALQAGRILPDAIFVDLNAAVLNDCAFLEAYERLKGLLTKQIELYLVSPPAGAPRNAMLKRFSFIKEYLVKPLQQEKLLQVFGLLATPG